jgi:hypothetical protein
VSDAREKANEEEFFCDGRCDDMGCQRHAFEEFVDREGHIDEHERGRYAISKLTRAVLAQLKGRRSP